MNYKRVKIIITEIINKKKRRVRVMILSFRAIILNPSSQTG